MELFSGGYPVRITIMQRGFAAHIARTTTYPSLSLSTFRSVTLHPKLSPGILYDPTFSPITSPETTISTRRFFWRPSLVWLSATGLFIPKPFADNVPSSIP